VTPLCSPRRLLAERDRALQERRCPREDRVRPAAAPLPRRLRVRRDDEPEPANHRVRPRRLAGRDGGVLLRQDRRMDRQRRCAREGLHVRRDARRDLALLADQHRRLVVPLVPRKAPRPAAARSTPYPSPASRSRSSSSPPRSTAHPAAGPNAPSATSSTGTKSTTAATSPPGNSPPS
jgi:hypothetical protein